MDNSDQIESKPGTNDIHSPDSASILDRMPGSESYEPENDFNDNSNSLDTEAENIWSDASRSIWSMDADSFNLTEIDSDVDQDNRASSDNKHNENDILAELQLTEFALYESESSPALNDKNTEMTAVPDEQNKEKEDSAEVPNYQQSLESLEKAALEASRMDSSSHKARLLDAQSQSVELIDAMFKNNKSPQEHKPLQEILRRLDIQKSNDYLSYLHPSTAIADLALAKIASGTDEQITEGEKGLLDAVRKRPELQFNPEFNRSIERAYEVMAENRRKAGLPSRELPDAGTDNKIISPEKSNNTTSNPSDYLSLLEKANSAYSENQGNKNETDDSSESWTTLFKNAIEAADKLDHNEIKENSLNLFQQRLQLLSRFVESKADSIEQKNIATDLNNIADLEWQNFVDYLAPATIRANAAFAFLSNGSSELVIDAKRYLAEAIDKRPELEFSQDYQQSLRNAFQAHHRHQELLSNSNDRTNSTTNSNVIPVDGKSNQVDGKEGAIEPSIALAKDLKPDYKELTPGAVPEIDNEEQYAPYLADRLTGPVLTAALLALGYKVVSNRIQRRLELNRAAQGEAKNNQAETRAETITEKSKPNTTDRTSVQSPEKTAASESTARERAMRGSGSGSGNSSGDLPPQNQSERPTRTARNQTNIGNTAQFEIKPTGERVYSETPSSISHLSWKERLTDIEMREIDRQRLELERKLEKDGRLTDSERKSLDSLRHFDKNKHDPKLHREILSKASGRPEGGFSKQAAGRLLGVSIIASAMLSVYIANQAEAAERPLPRARYNR